MQEAWLDPTVGKIPWRRKWQPTLGFLPGKSHGQRSLWVLSCCGVRASYCGDFSGYGTEALGCMVFISCGSWDLEQGLNNCVSWAWLFTVCEIILD